MACTTLPRKTRSCGRRAVRQLAAVDAPDDLVTRRQALPRSRVGQATQGLGEGTDGFAARNRFRQRRDAALQPRSGSRMLRPEECRSRARVPPRGQELTWQAPAGSPPSPGPLPASHVSLRRVSLRSTRRISRAAGSGSSSSTSRLKCDLHAASRCGGDSALIAAARASSQASVIRTRAVRQLEGRERDIGLLGQGQARLGQPFHQEPPGPARASSGSRPTAAIRAGSERAQSCAWSSAPAWPRPGSEGPAIRCRLPPASRGPRPPTVPGHRSASPRASSGSDQAAGKGPFDLVAGLARIVLGVLGPDALVRSARARLLCSHGKDCGDGRAQDQGRRDRGGQTRHQPDCGGTTSSPVPACPPGGRRSALP